MRRLHAIAARRGFSHEDLHTLCGVQSLTELSDDELHNHATRLDEDQPTRGYRYPPTGPTLGASQAQRRFVFVLARDLEWSRHKLLGWLKSRAGLDDLDRGYADPLAVASAKDQLLNILAKESAARGWQFRRTRSGYVLDKRSAPAADTTPASLRGSVASSLPPEVPF